jgi:preprotein translocase subunit SecE
MSDKKEATMQPSFFGELFQFGLYKRTQGKIIRQATFFALLLIALIGAWRLRDFMETYKLFGVLSGTVLAWIVAVGGAWLSYRLVNVPRFADFLIAVESEYNKISWPSQTELYRSVIVVVFVMALLASLMFVYDFSWAILLDKLGIVNAPKG